MQRLPEIVLILLLFGVHCAKLQRPSDLQPKSEKCERSSEFMYRQCCVFPPFFTRGIAKACGAIFALNFMDKEHNISAFSRQTPLDGCDHWRCVLKKYGFLTQGESVDDEKYFAHLDKWAELNPIFTNVLTNAQVHCKNAYRMFMPLDVCEFFKLQGCIRNYVNVDCPAVIPTKTCIEKKVFFEECREFFI